MAIRSFFELNRQTHSGSFSMKNTHTHSNYEIFYLVKGNCDLQIANMVHSMGAGHLAVVEPDIAHKTSYIGECTHERICLNFSEEHLTPLYETYGKGYIKNRLSTSVMSPNEIMTEEIYSYLLKIEQEKNAHDALTQELVSHLFLALIINIIRCHDQALIPGKTFGNYSKNIETVINYIDINYASKINLTSVSNLVGLNSSYFSKLFKNSVGIGFAEYLGNVRLVNAERLLLETNKGINEIAFETGFETSNYFGDVFKKKNGVSPSEFRKCGGHVS